MTGVLIRPRSDVFGLRLPTNRDGSLRPLMRPDRPFLTVHYVGSGSFLDLDDTPTEIRAIEAWASSGAKKTPWEYNWVVDGQGQIWTYAGEYLAAHSSGENSIAHGVLLLLGATEAPTDAMVLGFRQLRWWLIGRQHLAVNHQVRGHRDMPAAGTTCPGPGVLSRWTELTAPWSPPIPPPPPQLIPQEDSVRLVQPFDGFVPDAAVFVVTGHVATWVASSDRVNELKAKGASVEPSAGNPWPIPRSDLANLTLVGPVPYYPDGTPGGRTVASDFLATAA